MFPSFSGLGLYVRFLILVTRRKNESKTWMQNVLRENLFMLDVKANYYCVKLVFN